MKYSSEIGRSSSELTLSSIHIDFRLFNKDSVIELLLDRSKFEGAANCDHIKGLRVSVVLTSIMHLSFLVTVLIEHVVTQPCNLEAK